VENDASKVTQADVEVLAGQELRRLRVARGWTQESVAAKMRAYGYTWHQTMVAKIEAGTRPLRVKELADLAALFGVSLARLTLPQIPLDETEAEIAELEPELTAAEQRMVAAEADRKAVEGSLQAAGDIHAEAVYEFNRIRARLDYLRRRRDELTGKAQARQPVVAAVVTSPLGLLVGRRNDRTPEWSYITGEIEPGESAADAAVREVKEETGLVVKAGRVLGERDHPVTGRHLIYMVARPTHGTDIFGGDRSELAEVRWIGLAEATDLLPGMFPPVRAYLARALKETSR
jgi:8-oxo-dGTP diphosphatase